MYQTIILATFLTATLALGLWSARGVKTMKDYALANRSLGTGVLTMTLLATLIGSGDLSYISRVFIRGACHGVLSPITFIIGFILVGVFIAPNVVYFRDCLTTGDLMEKLYGNNVGIFSGIVSLFVSILVASTQLQSIGEICNQRKLRICP